MERLPCYLRGMKHLLKITHITTTTTSFSRRSLNQLILHRQYASSKLPSASRVVRKECPGMQISNKGRLLRDYDLRTGVLQGARWFHTTGRRDALPPLLWIPISMALKVMSALSGRKYRNWLKTQPEHIRKKHWRGIFAALSTVIVSMVALGKFYYDSHLKEVPMTGRKRYITLTREQVVKVAEYESDSFVEKFGDADRLLPPDHPKVERIINVANRIIFANQDFPGMKETDWTAFVVKDDERNAFVVPNGVMFVYTGMLDFVENDDQLAVLMAHEMAHALLLHGAETLSYNQFLDYFVIALMAALWLIVPSDGIAFITNWFYKKVMNLLVHNPYSRTMELEADQVGLYLAGKACFDVREGSVLWHRMSIIDDMAGQRVPEWTSTHPTHSNRVKYIDHLLPKVLAEREQCNCPKLPDLDPRRRAILDRQNANNELLHKATKANIARLHVDHVKKSG